MMHSLSSLSEKGANLNRMRHLESKKAWSAVIEHSGRSDGDRYKFKVLDTEEFNAMAGGGHIVFITTTALEATDDEALRGLLAHELGHHVGAAPDRAFPLEIWIMRPVIWAHLVSVGARELRYEGIGMALNKRRTGTFVTVILLLSFVAQSADASRGVYLGINRADRLSSCFVSWDAVPSIVLTAMPLRSDLGSLLVRIYGCVWRV